MKGLLYAGIAALGVVLTPVGEAAAQNLRFGHANTPGEIAAALFDEFAARVKERTDGKVTIQVFPGEQLGKEVELVQQVRDGALDISAPSMAAASTLVPALEIPSTPFLWTDWREAEAVISGPAMQPVFDELEKSQNIIPLTKIWYWGWRNFTFANREVRKPEDMQGLKIRVPESPVWVEMVKGLGAAPTPIAFSEVYTALQQGTVDGQENPIPTIYSRKFYEVQGVLTMSRHMLQNNMILMNKASFERLDPAHQRVLIEEARAMSAKNTLLQQNREQGMLEQIREAGNTKIIEDADRAAFAEKTKDVVFSALAGRWGQENIDRVVSTIEALRAD